MTPRRRWGALTGASAVMIAHQPLSSVMCSNDDIDWSINSLMLSFHDLRGVPVRRLVPMIFDSVS